MAGCCFKVNQRSLRNKWISVSFESNILTTLPFKENTTHAVVLVMAECDTHHTTTVASQLSGNALADIRWHEGNQIYFQCVNGPTLKGIRKCFKNQNSNNKTKLEQLERLRSEDAPAASWLPILLSHIGSQVRRRQSQSYKFEEFAKISNFLILKQTSHATHFLKLLDKMCKYERNPMGIVEETERTRFCPQTDRRTDWQTNGRTDGQAETSIPPFQLRWSGG